MTLETHPLKPFLPANAKVLMLGSFPPPKKRWCIDFYYPNFNNDMWRIFGLVFFSDKNHFVDTAAKKFRQDAIVDFLNEKGIAIYDTATREIREKDNASDKFLTIVEPTDLKNMLKKISFCQAIVTTGQKATDTLCAYFSVTPPSVGESVDFSIDGKAMRFYRMPSSSRAYPLAIDKKAAFYRDMFRDIFE